MIKECSNSNFFMFIKPLMHSFKNIFISFWLSCIKRHFMWFISPVICNVIIHLGWIPYTISQKCYCIFMPFNCIFYNNFLSFLIIFPQGSIYNLIARSINYFPPNFYIMINIWLNLLFKISIHYFYY